MLGMLQVFWREVDAASLFADFGFGARVSLGGEVLSRLQRRWLPGTPDTADLASLFEMLFEAGDTAWISAIDKATQQRLATLLAPGLTEWRRTLLDAITILVSAVHASGYTPSLRQRMDRRLLDSDPFRQLTRSADALRSAVLEDRPADALREAALFRAVLGACQAAADSVTAHLEEFGISVDIVYELDQMRGRTARIEQLLDCVLSPEPQGDWQRLMAELLQALGEATGLRALLRRHYSLLARQVAERSAESGSHYITRSRDEYRDMLRRAAGGGMVIAGTTFAKFAIGALGLTAFWSGFWSGTNYALSFVIVMLLHWTVATKQPAMTAPALAATLPTAGEATPEEIEGFVDRVAQLIRSQVAALPATWRCAHRWSCWCKDWRSWRWARPWSAPGTPNTCCTASPCWGRPRCSRPSPACCCSPAHWWPAGPKTGLSSTGWTAPSPGTRASSPAWAQPARSAGQAGGGPISPAWRPMCRWA